LSSNPWISPLGPISSWRRSVSAIMYPCSYAMFQCT
jgi:hypothetical protein